MASILTARRPFVGRVLRRLGAALLLLVGLAPATGQAAMVAPCADPALFGGAAVNVLVLPYTAADERHRQLSAAAQTVALLSKFDILATARYGSLGVVRLEAEGGPSSCDADDVLSYLQEAPLHGPFGEPHPGSGIIVLWGRFFETGGSLYVQSYLSFLRYRADTGVRVELSPSRVVDVPLPGRQVAFAPRRLSLESIDELVRAFERASVLRQEAEEDAPVVPMAPDPVDLFAYRVRDAEEGWLVLESFGSHPSGYVRLGAETQWLLRSVLPELHFVDGLIGHLTLRARHEGDGMDFNVPDTIVELIETSLARYRGAVEPDREPLAAGLSHALEAVTRLLAERYGEGEAEAVVVGGEDEVAVEPAALVAVDEALADMTALLPHNPDALRLSAFVRLAASAEPRDFRASEAELTRALIAAPGDPDTMEALDTLYGAMAQLPALVMPYSRTEVQQRREALDKLRAVYR